MKPDLSIAEPKEFGLYPELARLIVPDPSSSGTRSCRNHEFSYRSLGQTYEERAHDFWKFLSVDQVDFDLLDWARLALLQRRSRMDAVSI